MKPLTLRGMYAVLPEANIFLLYIGERLLDRESYTVFMQLPDRYEVRFQVDELSAFLKIKNLELVEQLPQDVFDVCVANIS